MTESGPDGGVNTAQREFWNTSPGQKWVRHETVLNALTREIAGLLLDRAAPAAGERIVDIGCGTGETTRALAARVGASGHVLGVDISEPMLARAREHGAVSAAGPEYLLADVQLHTFEPPDRDLLTSRFGVMFFADPVAAMRNLRDALRPGGRACFLCWAGTDENPWFRVPREVAMARLGRVDPPPPRAPGPMAFAETDYVLGILREAGFESIGAEKVNTCLTFPGDAHAAGLLAGTVGPAARIVREFDASPDDIAAIGETIAAAFRGHETAGEMRLPASVIVYTARR
ncbi:MAG: class I SAM-dependent methyltransferase [Paracoccaceae bacterium]